MRIKELREERHILQKELGDALGIAQNTLSQYETGRREPDLDTTQKIADFFGVSVDYLLGREAQKEKPLINNDEELTEYLDELRSRPEKRMLFSVTKNATKAQIEAIVKMIEEMQGN